MGVRTCICYTARGSDHQLQSSYSTLPSPLWALRCCEVVSSFQRIRARPYTDTNLLLFIGTKDAVPLRPVRKSSPAHFSGPRFGDVHCVCFSQASWDTDCHLAWMVHGIILLRAGLLVLPMILSVITLAELAKWPDQHCSTSAHMQLPQATLVLQLRSVRDM